MALKETLAEFGIEVDSSELKDANGLVGKFSKSLGALKGALAALGAALAVGEVVSFALETAIATDNLDKAAQAAGVATREFAQWGQVIQNNGGSLEDTASAIKDFGKNLGDAQKGNEDLQASFRKMGVALRDNQGEFRPTGEVMEDVVLNLDKMGSSARQTGVALQLFGEVGLTMIRINKGGAESLREQKAEFDRLQGVDFEKFVESSKEVAVSLDNWRNRLDALTNRITGALLPVITPVIDGINDLVEGFLDATDGTSLLTALVWVLVAALGALAVAGIIAFAPILAPVAAVAAAIGAVVLVVDDLINLFTGGRSVIGGVIDDLFGFGTAANFVEAMKIGFDGLIKLFHAAVDVLTDLIGKMDQVVGLAVDVGKSVGGFLGDVGDFVFGEDEEPVVERPSRPRIAKPMIDDSEARIMEMTRRLQISSTGNTLRVPTKVEAGNTITLNVSGDADSIFKAGQRVTEMLKEENDRSLRNVREYLDNR